ncbi:MAG: acetoacetate--CoA ligase [Candidatus Marinimicrobia bacterium]|nr:acetoacetate--CoA ligase [Candidatus Neomarinimicrobiota bacterium]
MTKIMWQPGKKTISNSQMDQFRRYVNDHYNLTLSDYVDLYDWSITNVPDFWSAMWEFGDIIRSKPFNKVVDDATKMPGSNWFLGTRLNYAENLLRYRDDRTAIVFLGEGQPIRSLTYRQLYEEVRRLAFALRELGVDVNDRVAGFMPNMPETVIAMLATVSVGAIWSSSSPDFGIKGVLDRFTQIEPKVLFSANGYFYNGKAFDSLEKIIGILQELPSVEKVVIVPYTDEQPDISKIRNGILYKKFLPKEEVPYFNFEQLPFNHPLYIMYSSGTTGLPKSIVHGAGGTLIQHLKELRLHTNLTREDTIFYFTTCGWMMWNWLVSSLSVGAIVVLYDGAPFYPDAGAMWQMTQDLGITVFGTSAKFISACESACVKPREEFDLSKLRAILSTGSPLVEESFDYVYRDIKEDVLLSSISGGTDIISCFALGNPTLPVYRGELQCRGLGMKVESFNEQGKPLLNEKGELVCTAPFPSMPIYFWNDPDNQNYHEAYFDVFPGVWTHGDFVTINEHGGVKIFGRSDATLNPGGVRIGTAEIYRVVESLPEVNDSLVVGQNWQGDERIILFVKMKKGNKLTGELIDKIKKTIRAQCSPRHVPAKVLPIDDIPYTINLKKVEIAVKKIIHGDEVLNRDTLMNPESLDLYKYIPDLQIEN